MSRSRPRFDSLLVPCVSSLGLAVALALAGCPKKTEDAPKKDDKVATTTTSASSAAPVASTSASAPPLEIVGKRVDIDVGEHGFTPSEIHVTKGEPTTLVFTRTSNSTCAFDVVFPELDVKKDLPMKRPVAIVVPVEEARTLTFTCGMKMYKSSVVIQ
jgi:hypothetical protein